MFIIKITVVSISNNIGVLVFIEDLRIFNDILQKSAKHVSITVEFPKLFNSFIAVKSMHEGLCGFLNHVLSLMMF